MKQSSIALTIIIMCSWAAIAFNYVILTSPLGPGLYIGTPISELLFNLPLLPLLLPLILVAIIWQPRQWLDHVRTEGISNLIEYLFQVGIVILIALGFFKKWFRAIPYYSRNIMLLSLAWGSAPIAMLRYSSTGFDMELKGFLSPGALSAYLYNVIPGFFPIGSSIADLFKDVLLTFTAIAFTYVFLVLIQAIIKVIKLSK